MLTRQADDARSGPRRRRRRPAEGLPRAASGRPRRQTSVPANSGLGGVSQRRCSGVVTGWLPPGAAASAVVGVGDSREPPRCSTAGSNRSQDFVDRGCGVGAEHGHELRGWHLLPLAGEECLEPQQVRRVPGREHRQRAEQAHPRPGRARFALRAVQAGQLVGAGGDEHVPLRRPPTRRSRCRRAERGDQLRVVARERGGVVVGEHGRRLCPAQQIVLGVLDDRLDRLAAGSVWSR